jgi:murein DD-endopeptidase MepM/ murein hydrolase activator NlpD
MKRALAVAVLVLVLLVLPTSLLHVELSPAGAAVPALLTILRGSVTPNASLAGLLQGSLSGVQIQELVETGRPVHDLARLAVGRPYALATTSAGELAAFTYRIDELRTLRVFRRGAALTAELSQREYETRVETTAGLIESSLFGAVLDSGEQEQLALELAEIFAWDVDFNTEIQKGDGFRVAVEKLYLDGRFARYGRIVAAEFTRGTRRLEAVRFDRAPGGGFYAPDGTPLRKAFLRSPLKFSRITSGFTQARFHPILGRRTPHLGIDFGAPTGTPVQAAADGVVSSAGWMGGYGNMIKLRHANGFETLYGHLSKLDVRAGQRVSQGDDIGRVGSTGLSTGPHLDYRMLRNGTFVNPLRVQLPPAEPIADSQRAEFEAARQRALALLPPQSGPAEARARAAQPPSATLPISGGASP